MKILLVLGHPEKDSFNHAIAEAAAGVLEAGGHQVFYHDLYEERFDPILPAEEIPNGADLDPVVKKHCEELSEADGIIIVHPNWWGQPPAVLKGWIDRVIRVGVAYRFLEGDSGEGVPFGLLRAKAALVFNTSNTSVKREMDVFSDPLEALWKRCIFNLCGVKTFHRRNFGVIVTSTSDQRARWLKEVEETVDLYFPETK